MIIFKEKAKIKEATAQTINDLLTELNLPLEGQSGPSRIKDIQFLLGTEGSESACGNVVIRRIKKVHNNLNPNNLTGWIGFESSDSMFTLTVGRIKKFELDRGRIHIWSKNKEYITLDY